jgi:hypothetical protein
MMSKFKESVNKIQLDEEEKDKMLKKILNHEKETEVPVRSYAFKFATFVFAFILLSGTCYALVKVFNFDEKFKEYFGKTDEELTELGVVANEVNAAKEFDNATIKITQTVMDEKELNIMVDIVGKSEKIYLEEVFLSSGESFDVSQLTESKNEDGTISHTQNCDDVSIYGCYSYGFANLTDENLTTGYIITVSLNKNAKVTDTVTMHLITNHGNYDIAFDLNKNDMKVKETKYDDIEIYNEGGTVVKVSAIRLTPLHIIVDMKYNKDINTITNSEMETLGDKVYNDNSNNANTYVTYKDGTTKVLTLWYDGDEEGMTSPYGIIGTKEDDQVTDIETVKSVTINGVTFNID